MCFLLLKILILEVVQMTLCFMAQVILQRMFSKQLFNVFQEIRLMETLVSVMSTNELAHTHLGSSFIVKSDFPKSSGANSDCKFNFDEQVKALYIL